jgi:hydrogenase/urease accessory protein HupE
MRSWRALLLVLLWLPVTVPAHEMTIAEMEVREVAPGEFYWQWTASGARPASEVLSPAWPSHCASDAAMIRCGGDGLRGTLSIAGVGNQYSAAIVKVAWLDGAARAYTVTAAQPVVRLFGSAEDRRDTQEIAWAYLVLGVEHILTGFDHLLFVVALLFLVGFNRRLFWTITAFTVAHSLTLALSALGWVTLRQPPVEATIALSIVLVAGEALHDRTTWSRSWPALVAFLFGLVHGLGFAGALREIGLPGHDLWTALVTFNVGVEVGQVFVVGVAYAAWRLFARIPHATLARAPALYVIGSVAAFWSIDRIAAMLGA